MDSFISKAMWTSDIAAGDEQSKEARIVAIAVLDANGSPTMKVLMGEKLTLKVLYQKYSDKPLHIHVVFKNKLNQVIFSTGTYTLNIDVSSVKKDESAVFELVLDFMVEAGEYMFMVKIAEASPIPNRGIVVDSSPWLGPLTVQWDYEHNRAPFFGMFGVPCKGKIELISND
jgi:lipopolysaccharide transport system ATP-binding protein